MPTAGWLSNATLLSYARITLGSDLHHGGRRKKGVLVDGSIQLGTEQYKVVVVSVATCVWLCVAVCGQM